MAFVEFENVGKTYHMGEVEIHALHDTVCGISERIVKIKKNCFHIKPQSINLQAQSYV